MAPKKAASKPSKAAAASERQDFSELDELAEATRRAISTTAKEVTDVVVRFGRCVTDRLLPCYHVSYRPAR